MTWHPTAHCSDPPVPIDFNPFVWTGSPDQEFVRGEWEKYWRLSPEDRSHYEVRRYSACGMIVPVLKEAS